MDDAILEDVALWVNSSPARSVIIEYSNNHWAVVFNGPGMVPVGFSSGRDEFVGEALRGCLEAGLKAVGTD